jgi:hypothetical protein
MKRILFFSLLFTVFSTSCKRSPDTERGVASMLRGKGALLTTHFDSYEAFNKVVQIEYKKGRKPGVRLTHQNNGQTVTSVLDAGISEADIMQIRAGSIWEKIGLCFRSPFFVINRQDVLRVFLLGRRRHNIFGWKDVAFYDLAETMMAHIVDVGLAPLDSADFSEKGYINTFNHITSQAFMTTLFSEKLADFIADTHERSTLPALITGDFTEDQIKDIQNGAVDNYVDFINNEWGQELGKLLKRKYNIQRATYWTPQLLADYLNDMQKYYSQALDIGFEPFRTDEEVIIRFCEKLNIVMGEVSKIKGV